MVGKQATWRTLVPETQCRITANPQGVATARAANCSALPAQTGRTGYLAVSSMEILLHSERDFVIDLQDRLRLALADRYAVEHELTARSEAGTNHVVVLQNVPELARRTASGAAVAR